MVIKALKTTLVNAHHVEVKIVVERLNMKNLAK